MGKILIVRILPCDGSTYRQTVKLLFSGQCIANGNASACGGINGHFAFDGDSGLYLSSTASNAAAADGRAAGNCFLFTIQIQNCASCAALCGDVGGTGFGALDGDFISSFISGSVIVRFGFCAAADASCTNTALCILDGDIALDGHVTSAKSTAANTGTFFAADGAADLSVASNDHIADANSAAANAGTTRTIFCIFDFGVAFNGHVAYSWIDYHAIAIGIQIALAAADASAVCATFCIFNDCITSDDDLAVTIGATADAGSSFTALCVFDDGITFNGHCAQTLIAAADASSHIATRGFGDGAAADGDSAISSNKSVLRYRAKTATNTGTIHARSLCGDIAVGNCDSTIAVGTAANTGTQTAARSGDRTARNCHIAIASGGVIVSAATNTGTVIAATGSDFAASNGCLSVISEAAADTGTASTTVGGKFTVVIIVRNGQSTAGFLSLGICFFIMLQTGMTRATRQSIITVQFNVRIAAAGHIHSGLAC